MIVPVNAIDKADRVHCAFHQFGDRHILMAFDTGFLIALGLLITGSGCLKASRLRHMFVEQTGLAWKTYLLWLRLIRALEVYSSGSSLTKAVHTAGFSDSAHFSRTFGLPATTLERP